MGYSGRQDRGPWNPLATLPAKTPLEGHDLQLQKYSSIYMSSCLSTPNANLVPSIFPGHSKYRQRSRLISALYFRLSFEGFSSTLFCGFIRLFSQAPGESWILSLLRGGGLSFRIDWLYPSHHVKCLKTKPLGRSMISFVIEVKTKELKTLMPMRLRFWSVDFVGRVETVRVKIPWI